MERRLAAIVATDVVGYSSLMGEDEAATLAALQDILSGLVRPKVAQYHGRIVKLMGDGALMEFPSVVEAVRFAVEVQLAMQGRTTSSGQPLRFRVGVNLGDIIIQGDDIFGDGVNIASRLEALAEPGGICISRQARDQVRDRLDLTLEDMGEVEVKNIARPVRVFRVVLNGKAQAFATPVTAQAAHRRPWARSGLAAAVVAFFLAGGIVWLQPWVYDPDPSDDIALPPTDKPSLAVLPFTDPSGEDYFADGITEDLITDLAKIPDLFVIARNSSFAYKGQFEDIRDVAAELGARYIVEGSVRRASDTIRITVQLSDAPAGRSIWAERYDRPLDQVFAVQDEVREEIVSALAIRIDPTLAKRLERRNVISVEAYDHLLRGIAFEGIFTREALLEARAEFRRVIALEPNFAEGHARLANTFDNEATLGWAENPDANLELALTSARKAVSLNPFLPYSHWTLGRILTHRDSPDEAREAMEKAIDLAPNYADAYAFLALISCYYGDAENALVNIDAAIQLNPRSPFWYYYARGMALYLLGRPEEAKNDLARSAEGNPNVPWARQFLIAALSDLGETDEAEWQIEELTVLGYPMTLSDILARTSVREPAYRERLAESYRALGIE